jgi:hypothetical protein
MIWLDNLAQAIQGRRGALIAISAAAFIVGLVIATPVAALFEGQQDAIQDSLQQLAVYRAESDTRPAIEAELSRARQQASAVPGLIEADNASLAQAKLQGDMESIVSASGGAVRSAQILPATRTNGFEILGIQYDIMLPASRLRDLTYGIESHAPYLFIDDADIVNLQDTHSGDPAARDPSLEVRWIVRGYRWAGAK